MVEQGPRYAHEGAALTFGVWLDDCDRCRMRVLEYPQLRIVVKTGTGRFLTTGHALYTRGADELMGAWHRRRQFEPDPPDYVREVFVAGLDAQAENSVEETDVMLVT